MLAFGAGLVVATASMVDLRQASSAPATTYGVSYYISPPLVQNSYVTTGASTETFNSGTSGASCAGATAVGTLTGTCSFSNNFLYGGATTLTSTATFGGSSSIYATGGGGSPSMTFQFTGARRYLGFWWSAGSASNTVKFFSGADLVLSLTTADLMTILGAAPTSNANFGTTGSVTAVDGAQYTKHHYFGHPRGHTQASPTVRSSVTPNEPFTYLHVFTTGGLTFDSVELSGGGFEFDNLVVSDTAQTPPSNLVQVGNITGAVPASANVVTFDPNGGTGTMMNQVASNPEALSSNTFTRQGFTFGGWSAGQPSGGTAYSDGATYNFASNITMYAVWIPTSITTTAPSPTTTITPPTATTTTTPAPAVDNSDSDDLPMAGSGLNALALLGAMLLMLGALRLGGRGRTHS